MGVFKTLRARLLSSQQSFNKYIFYNQKNIFCRMNNIFKKDLSFVCKTNMFCIKIYFSNEIYIFYIFIYIFLFFSKKIFNKKLFFYIKTFFLQIMYFVKNPNIFFVKNPNIFSKKKIFFFNLVLQQMSNHFGVILNIRKSRIPLKQFLNKIC